MVGCFCSPTLDKSLILSYSQETQGRRQRAEGRREEDLALFLPSITGAAAPVGRSSETRNHSKMSECLDMTSFSSFFSAPFYPVPCSLFPVPCAVRRLLLVLVICYLLFVICCLLFVIPNSPFPIPNSRFPIPHSPFPTHNRFAPVVTFSSSSYSSVSRYSSSSYSGLLSSTRDRLTG